MLVCSYGSSPRGQALHPIIMVWGSSSLGPPHDQPEFEHHLDQNFLLLGFMPAPGSPESSVLATMKYRLLEAVVGPLGSLSSGYARLPCKLQMLTHTQFISQRLLKEGKDVLIPRAAPQHQGRPQIFVLVTSLQGLDTLGQLTVCLGVSVGTSLNYTADVLYWALAPPAGRTACAGWWSV